MFNKSIPSSAPTLRRKLRAARAVTKQLQMPQHLWSLGLGKNFTLVDNKGDLLLIGGMHRTTRALDLRGRELYNDIKSLTAAIAAERLLSPIDA
jgi:hypothetical protein